MLLIQLFLIMRVIYYNNGWYGICAEYADTSAGKILRWNS